MRRSINRLVASLILLSIGFGARGPLAFENLIRNYPAVGHRYDWSSFQRGDYLIIGADAVFSNPYMELFRVFKERQGFRVRMAPLSETGSSTTDIRNYIADYYSNHNLEYVLLIGDIDGAYALPAFNYGPENDVTDLPYVLIEGGGDDYYPEAFIGRWPVDTAQELAKVIGRTMTYAQTPDLASGYLNRALVTAGNYGDTGTILTPVWTSYWLHNQLVDHGYTQVDTIYFPPTTGPEQILSTWNAGVGIVNYRGWGDAHGWHFPHFHVSDFDDGSLSNGNKLPIVFSFVCGTGKFDSSIDPAFCEALLTQGSISVPAGAVAVVAPSDLHTRTKFNNAMNTNLWDALLEGQVSELAPALLASKFGLLDEFVNELDPGEMAEFYFHTYNIMGDPSLPIWLLEPAAITLTAADFGTVFESDGLMTLERPDLPEGVFALRQHDVLIGAGRWTDGHIRIYRFDGASFYDVEHPGTALEITLNSAGHLPVTVELTPVTGNELSFAGMQTDVQLGISEWVPQLHNSGSSAASAAVTLSTPDGGYSVNAGTVNLPAGQTTTLSSLPAPVMQLTNREILLNLQIGTTILPLAIPIHTVSPEFTIEFTGTVRPLPNAAFTLTLSGGFQGMNTVGATINVTLSSAAEYAQITDNSGTATLGTDGSLIFSDETFGGTLGPVAHGSRLPLVFSFQLAGQAEPFFQQQFMAIVGAVNSTDPTPPDLNNGYWAYDDTDSEYPEVPTYTWLELADASGATHYSLGDDDHDLVNLPFTFRYYGADYDQLTINSNGWAAFGVDHINYFRNWSIPMPLGPDAMLAPFWDDLDNDTLVNGQEESRPIDLYTYHNTTEQTFIIEWYAVWNGFGDRNYQETFQIKLYDPAFLAADDGNGVVEFLYHEVHDVDQINNYSTVGIESPDQNDGLMYVYAEHYAPGAAELAAERVIRFTTNAPEFYVQNVVDHRQQPQSFQVGPAFPNPFNGAVTIPFVLKQAGAVRLDVFDLRGRLVATREFDHLPVGKQQLTLQTSDLASAVYLIRISMGGEQHIQKVTLLK